MQGNFYIRSARLYSIREIPFKNLDNANEKYIKFGKN